MSEKRWVMTISLDPEAPEAEAQALMEAVASLCVEHEPRTGWGAHLTAAWVRPDQRPRPDSSRWGGALAPMADPYRPAE